ncbi:hypothetical protein E2542_SST25210 [Spatholobus suberectus]|nr:hypothetical protein E2542_SST25210 [Spatholobus suberectus]
MASSSTATRVSRTRACCARTTTARAYVDRDFDALGLDLVPTDASAAAAAKEGPLPAAYGGVFLVDRRRADGGGDAEEAADGGLGRVAEPRDRVRRHVEDRGRFGAPCEEAEGEAGQGRREIEELTTSTPSRTPAGPVNWGPRPRFRRRECFGRSQGMIMRCS